MGVENREEDKKEMAPPGVPLRSTLIAMSLDRTNKGFCVLPVSVFTIV